MQSVWVMKSAPESLLGILMKDNGNSRVACYGKLMTSLSGKTVTIAVRILSLGPSARIKHLFSIPCLRKNAQQRNLSTALLQGLLCLPLLPKSTMHISPCQLFPTWDGRMAASEMVSNYRTMMSVKQGKSLLSPGTPLDRSSKF